MEFLEYCREVELEDGFPIRKGALVARLIAIEASQEETVRGPVNEEKDEVWGVELSSSIGASGHSSLAEVSNGKGEPGGFSVIFVLRYQISCFKKSDNRF